MEISKKLHEILRKFRKKFKELNISLKFFKHFGGNFIKIERNFGKTLCNICGNLKVILGKFQKHYEEF